MRVLQFRGIHWDDQLLSPCDVPDGGARALRVVPPRAHTFRFEGFRQAPILERISLPWLLVGDSWTEVDDGYWSCCAFLTREEPRPGVNAAVIFPCDNHMDECSLCLGYKRGDDVPDLWNTTFGDVPMHDPLFYTQRAFAEVNAHLVRNILLEA